ncbi:phosphoglycerate kinase [Patescibacteria group bacterium]|nr:phosphoglycerate kinase [Patescibacteria group bacterium]
MLKKLTDINIAGKTILYRAPYDIGVTEEDGKLTLKDTSRIEATIPTLQYLIAQKCKIVILTWVERPDGIEERYRTTPHAEALQKMLGVDIQKASDCVGQEVEQQIANLAPSEILMLENVRFHSEEDANEEKFARELCKGKELIVFDAFPQSHRKAASTTGILQALPAVAGLYFEKEYTSLKGLLDKPIKPFTVVIGGKKVADKAEAVISLAKDADQVLLTGGVANDVL